jgi:hypothetical protein
MEQQSLTGKMLGQYGKITGKEQRRNISKISYTLLYT